MNANFPEGLFYRDTRFLSEMELRVNGQVPEPLAATTTDPFPASFLVRGQPRRGRADAPLVVFRHRYVGRGMREEITIRNFGEEPAFCAIELSFNCDFADLFEVKEGRVERTGELRLEAERTRLTFTRRRGGVQRGTFVDFSTAPKINGNIASYELIIPARGQWSTCLQITPGIDATPVEPRYRCEVPVDRATPVERLAAWRRSLPIIASDPDPFSELLTRSTEDLAALRMFDPDHPDRSVVAAGAPWFMTLFGRASLLTSWMPMLIDPDLALGTLQPLARFQGKAV